jgi:hypothetical protein
VLRCLGERWRASPATSNPGWMRAATPPEHERTSHPRIAITGFGASRLLPSSVISRRWHGSSSAWKCAAPRPTGRLRTRYGSTMNGLQKQGNYTPRRKRERRALRLIATGSIASGVAIVGLVLAIAGVIGAALPIVALAVVGVCVYLFRRTVAG